MSKYHAYLSANVETIPQFKLLTSQQRLAIQAVSAVLPFKVNRYVTEELIDWKNIPEDPMFQLTFPQEGMLSKEDFNRIYSLLKKGVKGKELAQEIYEIRLSMNPHPGGQMDLNIPLVEGEPQSGMQHKYRETVLFFPSQGQTCHTYCTYCFRWAQFVGMQNLKFANNECMSLVRYLKRHPEVTDIILTGGDPMVMRTNILREYIEPLLDVKSLKNIRIGTKSVAWWPHRFVTDADADGLMRLFEKVVRKGKHLALMAHYSHPRELSTNVAQKAIKRIHQTGAVIRTQAPLIRHVNDSADVWLTLWKDQVAMGAVPYYMFVERDTGPKQYFEVPLYRSLEIYQEAFKNISGLGRTVRGPSMSATPGKILVDGVSIVNGQKVFVLKLLQGRNPDWSGKIFFAKYNRKATWISDLKPLSGHQFFFEPALKKLKNGTHDPLWDNHEVPYSPHPNGAQTNNKNFIHSSDSILF